MVVYIAIKIAGTGRETDMKTTGTD
jgi:hypothetical protein